MTSLGPNDLKTTEICNNLKYHIHRSMHKIILAAIKIVSFELRDINLSDIPIENTKQPEMSK